jgi:hypothetical protein
MDLHAPTARRRLRILWTLLAGLVLAQQVQAAPATVEALYDGAAWLLMQPGDLLTILALALLIGQRDARLNRMALVVLPAAWLCAGMASAVLLSPATWSASPVLLVVLGGLVAGRVPFTPRWIAAIATVTGLLLGLSDGAALKGVPLGLLAVAGVVALGAPLLTLVAIATTPARAPWLRISIQVAGSWLTAIGLLMIGWLLRAGA